jgi:hypothetical protein
VNNSEQQNFEDDMINLLTQIRNIREPDEISQEIQDIPGIERIIFREMVYALLFSEMIQTIREESRESRENRKLNILSLIETNNNMDENCECNICWDEKEKNKFVKFNCNHEFCKDCVIKSLRSEQRDKPCCALCRTEVKSITSRTSLVKNELAEFIS